MALIPQPDLEIRDEELLAAQAIERASDLCPELTNANPAAPHTVLLETLAWLLAQMGYRINQVPDQNLIRFARLFGIELRAATAAATTLHFVTNAPEDTAVTIPVGTHVSTLDGSVVFATSAQLIIAENAGSGDVVAARTVTGHTLLAPNKLVVMVDNVTFIESVTNEAAIDAGTEAETIAAALERLRLYQRRGERIVSSQDLEDAILYDALDGNGVVRAFPFVADGNFDERLPGYTTVVVMTSDGEPVDTISQNRIAVLLAQVVGNQFVYVRDPYYVDFNVAALIQVNSGSPEAVVTAAVESRLRAFYAAAREHFGKLVLRSDIIALIESTPGVERILSDSSGPILTAPTEDKSLKAWELPRLVMVTIDVD